MSYETAEYSLKGKGTGHDGRCSEFEQRYSFGDRARGNFERPLANMVKSL